MYGTTQVLAHGQSDYVREFGMTVTPENIVVDARVIATPVLCYGQGSKEATIVSLAYRSIIGHINDHYIVAPSKWAMEHVELQ